MDDNREPNHRHCGQCARPLVNHTRRPGRSSACRRRREALPRPGGLPMRPRETYRLVSTAGHFMRREAVRRAIRFLADDLIDRLGELFP